MASRQPGSGRTGDGRLFLSPEAAHDTPRRPRSHDPGPTAQILRHADRRDPLTPQPARGSGFLLAGLELVNRMRRSWHEIVSGHAPSRRPGDAADALVRPGVDRNGFR